LRGNYSDKSENKVLTIDCESRKLVVRILARRTVAFRKLQIRFGNTHPNRLSIGRDGTTASDQSKRVPVKPPGHFRGTDTVGDKTFVQSGCNTCKFAFVSHWNCQGREDTFPHPRPEGGPFRASSPNPRSESSGGAGGSPDGNPPRRRGQNWESGDAGGGLCSILTLK